MRLTMVAERPRARPRADLLLWRGLLWVAFALVSALAVGALDARAVGGLLPLVSDDAAALSVSVLFAAIPSALFALGVASLVRSLRAQARSHSAEAVARQLRETLPDEYVLLPRYLPRDSGDGEVDLVVVGPTGVFAVELRQLPGDVVCYQDVWYRRSARRSTRLADSPSRVARWNASRVRADLATAGFSRTDVEPLVVIARGRLADVASSSVPVVEGVGALARHVAHRNGAFFSPQRAQALADALRGKREPTR